MTPRKKAEAVPESPVIDETVDETLPPAPDQPAADLDPQPPVDPPADVEPPAPEPPAAKKAAKKPARPKRYAAYDTGHMRFLGTPQTTKEAAEEIASNRGLGGDRVEIREV